MAKISEVDALKAVDEALSGLEDGAARERVVRWAWDKYCTKPIPRAEEDPAVRPSPRKQKASEKKAGAKSAKGKTTLSLIKDLNLKPKGKKSFEAFASEKKPTSNQHKCTVSAYYLHHELGLSAVSADHVFTCFKYMKWRIPADLPNTLRYIASVNGWLDTRDGGNIKVTTMGDNLVEQDLPAKAKGSKKP